MSPGDLKVTVAVYGSIVETAAQRSRLFFTPKLVVDALLKDARAAAFDLSADKIDQALRDCAERAETCFRWNAEVSADATPLGALAVAAAGWFGRALTSENSVTQLGFCVRCCFDLATLTGHDPLQIAEFEVFALDHHWARYTG